jgi:flavin reductase (DIM6/NTAB) family NADH-FMN oxidoreductase RutF
MADGATAHTPATLADAVGFREGLARLATGVAVVACRDAAGAQGLLVSSLTGLSTEPPRVLFCVRKAAGAYAALLDAHEVSVTVLDDHDRDEAERFALPERATERFADGRWRLPEQGPPTRQGALATFSGPVHCRIDAGTHTIFILNVVHVQDRETEPLIYFERTFRTLA